MYTSTSWQHCKATKIEGITFVDPSHPFRWTRISHRKRKKVDIVRSKFLFRFAFWVLGWNFVDKVKFYGKSREKSEISWIKLKLETIFAPLSLNNISSVEELLKLGEVTTKALLSFSTQIQCGHKYKEIEKIVSNLTSVQKRTLKETGENWATPLNLFSMFASLQVQFKISTQFLNWEKNSILNFALPVALIRTFLEPPIGSVINRSTATNGLL